MINHKLLCLFEGKCWHEWEGGWSFPGEQHDYKCKKCGLIIPLAMLQDLHLPIPVSPDKKKETQIKWHKNNKDRVNKRQVEWRSKNKEKVKFYIIKSAYGISKEEYLSMLGSQENKCWICGIVFGTGQLNRPHIDHCHKTNKVRGLLCTQCNKGLGLFGDSINNLKRAIDYLRRDDYYGYSSYL